MPSLLAIIGTCLATVAAADHSTSGEPLPENRPIVAESKPAQMPDVASWWSGSSASDGSVARPLQPNPAPSPVVPVSTNVPRPLPAAASSHVEPSPAATAPPRPAASKTTSAAPAASTASLALSGRAEKSGLGKTSPLSALFTLGGSLSVVLGLFLVVAWAMRKTAPRGSLVLPKEVFDILGRAPLGARQQVQLLRCGSKLLLVSITPQGTETLTEVTDPLEVDRIAGLCQQSHPKSSTTAFRQVFQQLAVSPGKAEAENVDLGRVRSKRYRWEEKHA